jgi:prevent-host-death family protein
MVMATWQVQEAKARLSEVLKKAATEGPQSITVRGCPTAVVLSQEEFERLQRAKPGFVEFMRSSPLVGVDLDLRRDPSPTREVDVA